METPLEILYEDNHLLVINKPNNILVQGDQTKRPTLLNQAKTYLKTTYNKPGNVYLGLVHRLDRPVSGVMVFARTSKAASRLSEQIRNHRLHKTYLAMVYGTPPPKGTWTDHMIKQGYGATIVSNTKESKEAVLHYKRKDQNNGLSLIQIELITGRRHQIRVQCAHHGHPIVGDTRYDPKQAPLVKGIALHATKLTFNHPTQKTPLRFQTPPPTWWQHITIDS